MDFEVVPDYATDLLGLVWGPARVALPSQLHNNLFPFPAAILPHIPWWIRPHQISTHISQAGDDGRVAFLFGQAPGQDFVRTPRNLPQFPHVLQGSGSCPTVFIGSHLGIRGPPVSGRREN